MKKGYRILLHKDILLDLLDDSKKYCDLFIQEANTTGYGRSGGHGNRAFSVEEYLDFYSISPRSEMIL